MALHCGLQIISTMIVGNLMSSSYLYCLHCYLISKNRSFNKKRLGAVEARRAHNPDVPGSKPGDAKIFLNWGGTRRCSGVACCPTSACFAYTHALPRARA